MQVSVEIEIKRILNYYLKSAWMLDMLIKFWIFYKIIKAVNNN